MTVKDIKEYRTSGRIINRFFPAMICAYWISPYISYFCIKKKIVPNTITLFMIPVAILGSFLFSFDNLYCKLVGTLLFHIWFAIDLSDGQVARCTSTFSKYGEELDYLAHHICHIFFICTFMINIYYLNYNFVFKYCDNICFVLSLTALMIFAEYSFRNACSIASMMDSKDNKNSCNKNRKNRSLISMVKRIMRITYNSLNCIDNYIMLASIFIYFDVFYKTCFVLIFTVLYIVFTIMNNFIFCIRYTTKAMRG